MEKVVINATRRTVKGKQVRQLRRQGLLPGVVYGHNIDPIAISMDARETTRILSGLTASSLVTILLEGKESATLVREKQRNFIRGNLLHVDFQVVSLTEKIRAKVGIQVIGLAPAVKDFNGVLVNGIGEIEVEALPQDLPERITIDTSKLNRIGDGIYVRDLPAMDKVEILSDPDEMLVIITGSAEEAVEEVAVAVEEPEVIEKGKKEEEEAE
ncbi:MAG TPA: 50S ribosomal protein L25 [Anaerolineaceae bacterium]|nr:50S ribosomal protein L25 [Anaerolineaceae bacterium]